METAREQAAAEREKQIALIRAVEQAEVDDTRVKSETGTMLAMAEAQAKSTSVRAGAIKVEMLAKAEGKAALVQADNAQSSEVIGMKIDLARLETLPDVVGKMMKPAEKIDSIRINHITGFGGTGNSGGSGQSGDSAVVNQVVDGVLSMALQMPAIKKLGEEIGINIGDGLKGLSDAASGTDGDSDAGEPAAEPDPDTKDQT